MKRVTIRSVLASLLMACFFVIILASKNCDECFSPTVMVLKFIVCGLILFIGSLYFTRLFLKLERIIFEVESQPLLGTDEAVDGVPFSCEGTIEMSEKTLRSPYSNRACVYYHSIKEELVRSGKSKKWVIRENIAGFIPFYIIDERGKLKIDLTNLDHDFSGYKIEIQNISVPDPDNSEIDCIPVLKHARFGEPVKHLGFIPGRQDMRMSEYILEPGMNVFVHGFVSKKDNELVLHESERHPLIISQKTKEVYVEEFYKGRNLIFFAHVLISLGFTIIVLSANYFLNLYQTFLFSILLIGNGLISGSVVFTVYNRMVTLSKRAEAAFSNIDVELKRRSDLIPQIVEVVKKYAPHEQSLQAFVSQARVQMVLQNQIAERLNTNFSPLLAVVEKYPELKAAENFRLLMNNLIDAEDRISYSRAFYNRNVRKLNTIIDQVPFNIIALICNIKPMQFITFSKTP